MTWARADLLDRKKLRQRLEGRDFEAAVRRCIAAYVDPEVLRRDWDARFPEYVRNEALHTMTLEQLRCRG